MADATTLSLLNAAAGAVLYYPKTIVSGGLCTYVDRTLSVEQGQSIASAMVQSSQTARKVTGKLTYPVLDGDGNLARVLLGTFSFVMPHGSDLSDRDELAARVRSLIDHAVITAMVEHGESPW